MRHIFQSELQDLESVIATTSPKLLQRKQEYMLRCPVQQDVLNLMPLASAQNAPVDRSQKVAAETVAAGQRIPRAAQYRPGLCCTSGRRTRRQKAGPYCLRKKGKEGRTKQKERTWSNR